MNGYVHKKIVEHALKIMRDTPHNSMYYKTYRRLKNECTIRDIPKYAKAADYYDDVSTRSMILVSM